MGPREKERERERERGRDIDYSYLDVILGPNSQTKSKDKRGEACSSRHREDRDIGVDITRVETSDNGQGDHHQVDRDKEDHNVFEFERPAQFVGQLTSSDTRTKSG